MNVTSALLALAATLVVAGCAEPTDPVAGEPIPDGATIVRVTVADSAVTLEPATVRAGDVYLELDGGSVSFVQKQVAADAPPGPLTDADLERLARGDTFHTSTTGIRTEVRPGRYALVAGAPEADPVTGAVPPMAVLEVVP